MEDSILNTVKKAVGLMPEYDAFNDTLIMHINSVFMILSQVGIGLICSASKTLLLSLSGD